MTRRRALIASAIATAVIFVVLAGTQDRTAQILAEWGSDGIDAAKASLWIDYAFIVAYGTFLVLAAWATRDLALKRGWPRMAAWGLTAIPVRPAGRDHRLPARRPPAQAARTARRLTSPSRRLRSPHTREGTNRMQRCLESVLSRALKRNRIWTGALALCVSGLVLAPAAGASVTLGQLAPGTPSADCTTPGLDYLQPSVTGGNLYIAKQAGKIVSWSTNSAGPGATYVVKIFRRTTDPDYFQVMSHAPPHILTSGVNTVPVSLRVESGDMIGLNESGPSNSCTFGQQGDNVLNHPGDIADGTSGLFVPQNDVRLNLSAVLIPDNGFTVGSITKDLKRGTATITVTTTNPGFVSIAGKGIKKRASKDVAVAGPVTFSIATIGKTKRRLARKGKVVLAVRIIFSPNGGDPSTQTLDLKLGLRKPPTPTPKS